MSNLENEVYTEDKLMSAIGKAELLSEQHEEAIEELEDETEDIEGWLTVIFKALKNVF